MADQGGLGDADKDLAHDEQSKTSTGTAFGMPGTAGEAVGEAAGETAGEAVGRTEGEAAGDITADEQIDAADQAIDGSVGL